MSTNNRQARIYNFLPVEVAQTETDMWRAYYDKKPVVLLKLSIRLLEEQLAFSGLATWLNAYRLTRAAFAFKRGRQRQEYQRALRWLVPFYQTLRARLNGQWDAQQVAELELEWWIVHRHDFQVSQTEHLEEALSALCSVVYHVPIAELTDYSHYRAEAMLLTDAGVRARERGELIEPDWSGIQQALEISYAALSSRLNQEQPAH